MITREEALKRLAEILKKDNNEQDEGTSASECAESNSHETIQDDGATRHSEGEGSKNSSVLLEYYQQYGGRIVNQYILDSRQITRKEYLAMTKGMTQSQLLEHPLLYAFFRSEDQSEFNFFEWLGKFKK